VHLVRTQLQAAADAAARAGAAALIDHPNDAAAAVAAVGLNAAEGAPVVLLAADVQVGNHGEAAAPVDGDPPRVPGRRHRVHGPAVGQAELPRP
jgi:hypothetical protein